MTRFTTLTFALLAAAGLTLAGCNKRDDMPPTGAGPATTTPSTMPSDTTGTPGSMSPTTPMPSASAASQ